MRNRWLAISLGALLLSTACSDKTGREVVSGRLRCVQHAKRVVTVSNLVWEVFADGKPLEDQHFSGSCVASPDPKTEALVLSRHSVRLVGGQPTLSTLGGNSPDYGLWACEGHCLVFSGGNLPSKIHHVDTGTNEELPRFSGQPLSLSPDRHALVAAGRSDKTTFSFCVVDVEAKSAVQWTVPRASFPWLEPCNQFGADTSECLARRGAKFQWHHDARGRDVFVPPPASAGARSQPSTLDNCGHEQLP